MRADQKKITTIDAYIRQFPPATQALLKKIRAVVRAAAPKAGEAIKYGIPTFTLNGNLVHFGGFKSHVSFFPASSGIRAFKKELVKYATDKGTVRFPIGKPIPYTLIHAIVRFRLKEQMLKK